MSKQVNYFDHIAGYASEKKMMMDLANLIKNKDQLKTMGGRLPKGLLLIGENGLGKTALAKAFIKTSNAFNVNIDCSSFEPEEFKQLVQDKFKEASEHTPSIIFIDELDKIAGSSINFDTGDNFNHFKDLLSTINDYLKVEDIFILACANENFQIERSLIRSGRIDRMIKLNLPTQSERKEIFSFFSKDKKVDSKVNFTRLAKMSNGFTGADIEVIMNEATIIAFNDKRDTIKGSDIEKAISDKRFGPLERESEYDNSNLKVVASHEAGHAVTTMVLEGKGINRLSIAKRGTTEGYTDADANEESVLSAKDLYNRVVILLAGREAEKVFFNNQYTGSENDIYRAQRIVATLVTSLGAYGYDYLILCNKERRVHPTQLENRRPSEARLRKIEALEDQVMIKASKEAHNIIINHIDLMKYLTNELMTRKTLEKDEIDAIYDKFFREELERDIQPNNVMVDQSTYIVIE